MCVTKACPSTCLTDQEVQLQRDVSVPGLGMQLHVARGHVTLQVGGDRRVAVRVAGEYLSKDEINVPIALSAFRDKKTPVKTHDSSGRR